MESLINTRVLGERKKVNLDSMGNRLEIPCSQRANESIGETNKNKPIDLKPSNTQYSNSIHHLKLFKICLQTQNDWKAVQEYFKDISICQLQEELTSLIKNSIRRMNLSTNSTFSDEDICGINKKFLLKLFKTISVKPLHTIMNQKVDLTKLLWDFAFLDEMRLDQIRSSIYQQTLKRFLEKVIKLGNQKAEKERFLTSGDKEGSFSCDQKIAIRKIYQELLKDYRNLKKLCYSIKKKKMFRKKEVSSLLCFLNKTNTLIKNKINVISNEIFGEQLWWKFQELIKEIQVCTCRLKLAPYQCQLWCIKPIFEDSDDE